MKSFAAIAAALAVLATAPAQAQSMQGMDHKGMKGMSSEKPAAVHRASGTVTRVADSKVTIAHGPVDSLKWPAMTMGFTVQDKALLARLKQGQKVEFGFVESGKDYVITQVR